MSSPPTHSLFQILPWNGHKAALSLTFDDGNPAHVDFVVPELARRSLRATFYVIAGRLTQVEKWSAIPASGQEIGNHSMDHLHAQDLTTTEVRRQVGEARERLESLLGVPAFSFAYPFTETTPELRAAVAAHHFLGRGGNRSEFYLKPEAEPDWLDISSQVAMTHMAPAEYQDWVDENLRRSSWTVLQFHGIEGDVTGWQPLSKAVFLQTLDYIAGKQHWVATFSEVGAYWQAQKILEKTLPRVQGAQKVFFWERPALLPGGVVLKVKLDGNHRASQGGQPLDAGSDGTHLVSFDAGELTLEA